jgi:hypothetical protein
MRRWDGQWRIISAFTKRQGPDGGVHEGWCAIFEREACSCRDDDGGERRGRDDDDDGRRGRRRGPRKDGGGTTIKAVKAPKRAKELA